MFFNGVYYFFREIYYKTKGFKKTVDEKLYGFSALEEVLKNLKEPVDISYESYSSLTGKTWSNEFTNPITAAYVIKGDFKKRGFIFEGRHQAFSNGNIEKHIINFDEFNPENEINFSQQVIFSLSK